MRRTLQVYKYINLGLALFLGCIYWLTFMETMEFMILIGTAGILLLLLNHTRNITIISYLVFAWVTAPILYSADVISSQTGIWTLWFIAFLFVYILSAPATFLSGILYGFWMLMFTKVLIHNFQFGLDSPIEGLFNVSNMTEIVNDYLLVILIFGYLISALPYYISKVSPYERFFKVGGYILFIITLPITFVLGTAMGIYESSRNIIYAFLTVVRTQTGLKDERKKQPAHEIYWMNKAFRDWKQIRVNVQQENIVSRKRFVSKGVNYKYTYGLALGIIPLTFGKLAANSVLIFGFLLLTIESLIHLVVIGVIWLPIYIYYLLFFISDQIYLKINKVKTICPECYHQSILPNYVCSCDAVHTDLKPGMYGIRRRKCLCGNQLATTFLGGRNELHARCKNNICKKNLNTKEATPICISLVGGPSSGKTSFAISAIKELKDEIAPTRGWETEFLNTETEGYIHTHFKAISNGRFPNKTAKIRPDALNLRISSEKWRNSKLLYVYDPAGEAYQSSSELANHDYLEYVNGYVLVVDPFSLPDVVAEYESEFHKSNVNPSETLIEDTYDMLMVHLSKNHRIKENKKISVPIAVVIHKVDAFQLEKEIMSTKINMENLKDKSDDEILNEKCKAFLKGVGYQSFVKRLESKFHRVQFFMSSATESRPSLRSSDSITWLMGKK